MNKTDWIIVYLSVLLTAFQMLYTREVKKAAYLQGQADLYQTFASVDPDSGPYVTIPKRRK